MERRVENIAVALSILVSVQLLLLGTGLHAGLQIVSDDPKKIRLPLPARVILSLSLLLSALLIALSLHCPVGWLIFVGMILSFFGDMFNAAVIPLPVPRLGGMAAFGIAHPFYITAYYYLLKPTGSLASPYFLLLLAAVWLSTAISWALFVRNPETRPILNVGSLIYALLLGTAVAFAFMIALKLGGWWWSVFTGALLFYISDTIIGLADFGGAALKRPHLWIWLTYVPAQMGIIYGIWLGSTM